MLRKIEVTEKINRGEEIATINKNTARRRKIQNHN